jgi:hypothetical protein
LEGTVKADSLVLGPVTLHKSTATLHTLANGAEITAFDADILGGRVHGTGTFHTAVTAKDKPSYALEGQFEKLNSSAVGQLFGLRSSGVFGGTSKIELSGFTGDDLAASAKGAFHFEWQHGKVAPGTAAIPPALGRFDRWTADAEIANGSLTLKDNQVKLGAATQSLQAAVPLAIPPKLVFTTPKQTQAKR